MLPANRSILLGVFSLQLLSACGSTSVGTESGTIAAPTSTGTITTPPVTPPKAGPVGGGITGTDNAVASTASVSSLSVTVGASQTVSAIFTSNDGLPLSGFAVSGSLGTLPAGWSGPNSFTCAAVGPGSGCVLDLTYAPTAAASGMLTLTCVYVDNAGLARTPGPCLTLTYSATMPNNIAAYAAPAGEIDAVLGAGKQTVAVNFTTDDGTAATNFTLTSSLAALPAGWSSAAAGLSCPIVSTGSGCQLALNFAPSTAGNGTLILGYSYTDNSGAARTGALNIPYATASHDSIVGSVSPSGQINAAVTSGVQGVAVTFTTDDGKAAGALSLLSDLAKLPAGWSSTAANFSCDSVGTGNGCQLHLSYAPTSLSSGTLALRYAYMDATGAANEGLVNIPYAATTDDNVVGTASPSGQINAMLGAVGQSVTVTFSSDDARLATALQLTSSLSALPTGWSSASNSFSCAELSSGTGCQLVLMYAPAAFDNGTLTLNYQYVNNAGEAKTGTLAIPYRTTSNDSVVAVANPTALSVLTGSSNMVAVTFSTDDGNLAGGLSADLSALPPDWSSTSSTFNCSSVSTGSSCQLMLTYAPMVAANSSLSFGFSYSNAAGAAKTGTAAIAFVAAAPPPPPPPGP
jgi:hypothetical protein